MLESCQYNQYKSQHKNIYHSYYLENYFFSADIYQKDMIPLFFLIFVLSKWYIFPYLAFVHNSCVVIVRYWPLSELIWSHTHTHTQRPNGPYAELIAETQRDILKGHLKMMQEQMLSSLSNVFAPFSQRTRLIFTATFKTLHRKFTFTRC